MLKRKQKQYNESLMSELIQSINDQKQFWNYMRNISKQRSQPRNNIDANTWFTHFRGLLEDEQQQRDNDNVGLCDDEDCNDNNDNYVLNRPISLEEVLIALNRLKNRKAAGPDGIIGEMLKNASKSNLVLDFLVRFFNALFDRGVYPELWTESIVLPLFKKGNTNDPNNYRGISLCNVCSKVYSTVINNRLQEWVDMNNITGEFQAGFKRNYSTIDHIFTLMAFIQKQFSLNRKLYVAFIDYEKAFDSVNRSILWSALLKNGINSKLYKSIMSMYECVKARVRCGSALTEDINCTSGVKQDDICFLYL